MGLGLFALLSIGTASAQVLNEVVVQGWYPPKTQLYSDSVARIGSKSLLQEVLGPHSTLWIRASAPGQYASSGTRGLGGAQTTVFWEGLPLNSPALGVTDWSTLPPVFFSKVSVQSAQVSAGIGAGSAGGSIQLEEIAPGQIGTDVSAGIEAGSFGAFGAHATYARGDRKHEHHLALSASGARNDYGYDDPLGRGDLTRENADWERYAVLYHYRFYSPMDHHWSYRLWVQGQQTGIPDQSLRATSSGQRQSDFWIRQHLSFKSTRWDVKLGWFVEEGTYYNAALDALNSADAYDFNQAQTYLFDARGTVLNVKSTKIVMLAQGTLATVGGIHKQGTVAQGGFGAQASRVIGSRLGLIGLIKMESYRGLYPSGSLQLGYNRSFGDWKLIVARTFRSPTANDLLWSPGGNPDLVPEQGWNAEARWNAPIFSTERWRWVFQSAVWARTTRDLIRWIPGDNGIWSPENLDQSRGYGFEAALEVSKGWNDTRIFGGASAQGQWSQGLSGSGDWSVLPGQPSQRGGLHAGLVWKRTRLEAQYQTSSTWEHYAVGSNALSTLDPLHLLSLEVYQSLRLLGQRWNFWVRCDNLLDTDYAYVPFQPMPGRSLRVGIQCALHLNKPQIHESRVRYEQDIELIGTAPRP